MKTLIITTLTALSIGAATIPASAQTITFGSGADRGGDCRTVEKRKIRNGKTVITRERTCSDRDRYSDRRSYRDRDDDRYERRAYRDGNDRYVERRETREPGIYIGR